MADPDVPRASEADAGVLVMSHAHPALTHGGAEIAAHALFEALRAEGGEAWFLGCSSRPEHARLGAGLTQPFGAHEYLYAAGGFDSFLFANRDPRYPEMLERLLRRLRPGIVHAHHYTILGVESFALIRRILPRARILLTLHEFLAICCHYGQMVKTQSVGAPGFALCRQATPRDCAACFPERSGGDFFLRRAYLLELLGEVDAFIAPSRFLAARYIEWGLPAEKIHVIENVPARSAAIPGALAVAPPRAGAPLRAGFFGQISPLKGIEVLLRAARLLEGRAPGEVSVHLFGDASNQPAEFQARTGALLDDPGFCVVHHGPYRNEEVATLMASVDVVVVPSVWWENSPVVIQEALRSRRPVVCPGIGGMAEKVRDGLDGLHCRVGDPDSLACCLLRLAREPGLLQAIGGTLQMPLSQRMVLDAHLALYRSA